MSKVTETVSPKEMGKINGYTTTLDSLAQIVGPIIGTLLLFDPSLYGLVMGILAFVNFNNLKIWNIQRNNCRMTLMRNN
ncbi:unnamed protein product [marine sediment metagenome]|uniref:Major facilitator superfamily (MFS) profile domain-containing protein n=1 Tax=marine sediment metagenome TaxID=412755 RepID=X1E8K1_9ZZZZ